MGSNTMSDGRRDVLFFYYFTTLAHGRKSFFFLFFFFFLRKKKELWLKPPYSYPVTGTLNTCDGIFLFRPNLITTRTWFPRLGSSHTICLRSLFFVQNFFSWILLLIF